MLTSRLVLLFLLTACGIKAPPRPPIDEKVSTSPVLVDAPDAGCCKEKR